MKKYIKPETQAFLVANKQMISTSDFDLGIGDGNYDPNDALSRGRRGFWNDEEFDY